MERTFFTLISILLFISCNNTNESGTIAENEVDKITEEEALNLLHTWTDAYLTGNAESLKEILDDSWVYSGSSDGKTSNKLATIEEFSNADYSFSDISYQDLEVKIYNDIAVVRGSEKMIIIGNSLQDTTNLELRFTDVYQKKNGVVRAISTHSSPINDE